MSQFRSMKGETLEIRPISAYDAVRGVGLSQKTVESIKGRCSCPVEALSDGACIAHLSLYSRGRRRFSSPIVALKALSVEEIRAIEQRYLTMMAQVGKEGDNELL